MVKIRLVIILLLSVICITIPAGATITISNDTLLSQIPITTSDSNVTIAGTAVITVDATREFRLWSQGAGTRLRFSNTGHTVTMGGLRNLGRIDTIGSTDALEIKNRDLIAVDSDFVCWGAGGVVMSGNAARTAAIRGVSVGGVKPAIMYRSTSGSFYLTGGTVSGFRHDFGNGYVGGLNLLPATNRTVSGRDVYFSNVTFDSCAVHVGRTQTLRGFRMDQCLFNLSNTDGFIRTVSPCDTFYRVRVLHNHNGAAASGYGILLDVGADSAYVYGCHIDPLGASGENTLDRGIQVNAAYVKMDRDTVHNCRFNIVTTSSNSHSAQLLNSVLYGASHEQLHWEGANADSNWVVQGNLIYGGGARSLVTVYSATGGNAMKNLNFSYNTVVSTGGGKSAFGFDCPAGASCGYTVTGLKMVGNIFAGANASFNRADILVGGYVITATEFKKNVIDKLDTTTSAGTNDFIVPYSITDSNTISSAFSFVDSVGSDYRLNSNSPIINCGDTLYGDSVFGTSQHSKIPYDPGYYQSYTTGTCGGAPSTPTGACCLSDGTCPITDSANCAAQSGTYQGNGTSTCTGCTGPPSGGIGTGYGKRSWVSLATLTYGGSLTGYASFIGRKFDMAVNPGDAFKTALVATDPDIGRISYVTISTLRGTDSTRWATFAAARGYNYDSGFIWAAGGTNCLNSIAPSGAPCTGANTCTGAGNKMAFCSFNTYRNWPNMRYVGMQQFTIYKVLQDADSKGIMQDEATFFFQDTLTHYGTNSQWFPADPGYWTSGSPAQTNAWIGSGLTHVQIEDSLIRIKRNTWLAELMDSLTAHGKQNYANGAAYAQERSDLVGDAAILGSGLLFGEGMDMAMHNATTSSYPAMTWRMMDSIRVGGRNWQNSNAIIWTHIDVSDTLAVTAIDGTTAMKSRLAQERYCWYMMAQTPLKTFLFIGLNWNEGASNHLNGWTGLNGRDSLFKFCPSMDANLGAPSGARSVLSSGTGGTVYQRSFTNGKVLWRDGSGGSLGTSIQVSLGATYYPVNYDGTTGTQTSIANIRNGEGLIFLTSTAASTGNISIGDATVTEGGNMVFTVTLSAVQAGNTTFTYATSDGTAVNSTDYTGQLGGTSIVPPATTTTITVPTTNRSGCQTSRTFYCTITSVTNPSTLTISDAQGSGIITDDDCGVTYSRSYKGQIKVTGKVKP